MSEEPRQIVGFGWRRRLGDRFADPQDRQTIIAVAATLAVSIAIAVGALCLAAPARGEPLAAHHFELYHAARGAPASEMRWALRAGPFPLPICYAAAALNVSALETAFPDKDFTAACESGPLLTLRQLVDRAERLLPDPASHKDARR